MIKSVKKFVAAGKYSAAQKTFTVTAKTGAFTDQSEKYSANKTLIFKETGFVCPDNLTAKRTYFAGGKTFVYCSDGAVYECVKVATGGSEVCSMVKACEKMFEKEPLVIPVSDGGEGKTIITGEEGAVIIGVNADTGERVCEVADVPCGSDFAICAGRLFIANGRRLYFSESYDCTDFSTGVSGEGEILADGECGNITALAAVGEELFILCKRRVLVLSPKGDIAEWTLKKAATQSFSAVKNFAAGCGRSVVFFSDKRLFKYNANGLKVAKSRLNDRYSSSEGRAGSFEGALVAPIFYGGKYQTYIYDSETEEEFTLPLYTAFSLRGGFAADAEGKKIYRLAAGITTDGDGGSEGGAGGYAEAIYQLGTNYDFGTLNVKRLLKVTIKTRGAGTVRIRGDSATKNYDLKNGYNEFRMGIVSRRFRIDFNSTEEGFTPQAITFTYEEL